MTENRIDRTLQALKQQGKKALIPFVTAGHGGYDRTEQLVLQMEKAGADIIELGVPFSDPIAEGPVIQHASEQALKQGTTLAGIFELVKEQRNFSAPVRKLALMGSLCRICRLKKRTRFRAVLTSIIFTTSVW